VSWYQTELSLEFVDQLDISSGVAVIDVGGGTSNLVDALDHRGFTDVTVLDISELALQASHVEPLSQLRCDADGLEHPIVVIPNYVSVK